MANPKKKSRFSLDVEENDEGFIEESSEDSNSGPSGHHDFDENYDEDYASDDRYEEDQDNLIDFLKYPKNKRTLKDFVLETYKSLEEESVERTIQRQLYEHESEQQGSTPYHKPGHIGTLMYQYLNMIGVESAFSSGLQHTKSSLTKTVQQRVDQINTLLRGVGGFNRQIKASFSRSATIYLEQDDPRNSYRERVIFTVNLADFELRYPLDESANTEVVEDGRTLRRLVWDEAVNTLSEIISNTGLKPKYVKNDKNTCSLMMRQYLLDEINDHPDEYFSFDLRHVNEENREKMSQEYLERLTGFEEQISELEKKVSSWWTGKNKRAEFEKELKIVKADKDFYVATTPDPNEMDKGLVFSIYVNTMKDYTLTKDKMQVIMTKFILALSTIAVDKSMDQQVNTIYQQNQAKATSVQDLSGKMSGPKNKKKRPA